MRFIAALVSKAGGEVVLDDETLNVVGFLPLELIRDDKRNCVVLRLIGQPFGAATEDPTG